MPKSKTHKKGYKPRHKYSEARALGYRSMFEVEGARLLNSAKVPYEYEPKDKHVPYTINAEWVPDFVLNGRIYVELKGKFDAHDKRKLVAVRRCNPTLDLRIVFYTATKPNVRWAEKHGWKWAAKTIPEAWIKEGKRKV